MRNKNIETKKEHKNLEIESVSRNQLELAADWRVWTNVFVSKFKDTTIEESW